MSSLEQGKKFMNSLQKYIHSVEDTLPELQEPFEVATNNNGMVRIEYPSSKKECKKFAQEYGIEEYGTKSTRSSPFGECKYDGQNDFTWNPNKKTPLPDGFEFVKNNNSSNKVTQENNKNKKRKTKPETQLDMLSKDFNKNILKYTRVFNEYNEQLIKNNYATTGSTALLLKSNNDLTQTAENIYNSINIMSIKDKALSKQLNKKKKALHKSILELKEQQKKLRNTRFNDSTLDASFNDNKRVSESTNLKFMLFLIGTLILSVSIYRLNMF